MATRCQRIVSAAAAIKGSDPVGWTQTEIVMPFMRAVIDNKHDIRARYGQDVHRRAHLASTLGSDPWATRYLSPVFQSAAGLPADGKYNDAQQARATEALGHLQTAVDQARAFAANAGISTRDFSRNLTTHDLQPKRLQGVVDRAQGLVLSAQANAVRYVAARAAIESGDGKVLQAGESLPDGSTSLVVFENGAPTTVAVPNEIAAALSKDDPPAKRLVRIMQPVMGGVRRLLLTWNPAWQVGQTAMDVGRAFRNYPGWSNPAAMVKRYAEVIPDAWQVARLDHLRDKPSPLVQAAVDAGALPGTTRHEAATETERTGTYDVARILGAKPSGPVDAIDRASDTLTTFLEMTHKLAAFREMQASKNITPSEVYRLRTRIGSPDYAMRGTHAGPINLFFRFTTAAMNGLRADVSAATESGTRTGVAVKTGLSVVMPVLVTEMWRTGLLQGEAGMGDEPDPARAALNEMADWQRDRGLLVPVGFDEEGYTYLQIPYDHTMRPLATAVRLAVEHASGEQGDGLRALREMAQAVRTLVPSTAPELQKAAAALDYMQGRNPRDEFLDRDVFTAAEWGDEYGSGGGLTESEKLGKFTKWMFGGFDPTGTVPYIGNSRKHLDKDHPVVGATDWMGPVASVPRGMYVKFRDRFVPEGRGGRREAAETGAAGAAQARRERTVDRSQAAQDLVAEARKDGLSFRATTDRARREAADGWKPEDGGSKREAARNAADAVAIRWVQQEDGIDEAYVLARGGGDEAAGAVEEMVKRYGRDDTEDRIRLLRRRRVTSTARHRTLMRALGRR